MASHREMWNSKLWNLHSELWNFQWKTRENLSDAGTSRIGHKKNNRKKNINKLTFTKSSIFSSKDTAQEDERTNYRMGGNVCETHIWKSLWIQMSASRDQSSQLGLLRLQNCEKSIYIAEAIQNVVLCYSSMDLCFSGNIINEFTDNISTTKQINSTTFLLLVLT